MGLRGGSFGGGFDIQGKDFKEELLVELLAFLAKGGVQEVVGHVHKQAQISGGMFAEGLRERGAHEFGIARRFEQVVDAFEQLRWRQGLGAQAAADAAGQGHQVWTVQLADQAVVPGQNDGEDGARVQIGAGEQAQFREDRRGHFLGLIDEQDGAQQRGLNVVVPFFPQYLGAGPTVVRGQGHAKEIAQFAVEVGQGGLWAGEHAHREVAHLAQALDQQAQGGAFACARISADQGETTLADLLLDAPAEALDGGGCPEDVGGDLRGEGVELQAVKGKEFLVHAGWAGKDGRTRVTEMGPDV